MKNILITGGFGAIGSALAKKLSENKKNKIFIIDNFSSGYENNLLKKENIVKISGNLIEDNVIKDAFSNDINYIYHLAANFANQNSVDDPEKDLITNGLGTVKILEAATKYKISKILYSSSSCIYKPINEPFIENGPLTLTTPYAITKLLGEHYVYFYNAFKKIPSVIVRYFNSYGPGDYPGNFRSVVCNFFSKAINNEPLTITGDGLETRPFTYIDDIVNGTIMAMEKSNGEITKNYFNHPLDEKNIIYNISNPNTIKIKDLAEKINNLCQNKSGIKYESRRDWDVIRNRNVSVEKAKNELGFEASINIDEGLKRTLDWFKSSDYKKNNINK